MRCGRRRVEILLCLRRCLSYKFRGLHQDLWVTGELMLWVSKMAYFSYFSICLCLFVYLVVLCVVYLFGSLTVCLSVCLCLCLYVCLFVCLFVCLSVCLFLYISIKLLVFSCFVQSTRLSRVSSIST